MIRAVLVDDELHCRETLSNMIGNHFNDKVDLLAQCATVEEGVTAIKKLKPQLIFLDVEIGNSTGFKLLEQLDEFNFEVIFTTAHNHYAMQAIKFSALDFLLKPFGVDDMREALGRLEHKINTHDANEQFRILFENLKKMNNPSKKLALPTLNGINFVPVQDIIRCESDVNYTTFYLTNKNKIVVAKTLKEFEEMLDGYNFFRVHNSHLINLSHIKNYVKGEGGIVTMMDDSSVDVSRRRKEEFLKRLAEM